MLFRSNDIHTDYRVFEKWLLTTSRTFGERDRTSSRTAGERDRSIPARSPAAARSRSVPSRSTSRPRTAASAEAPAAYPASPESRQNQGFQINLAIDPEQDPEAAAEEARRYVMSKFGKNPGFPNPKNRGLPPKAVTIPGRELTVQPPPAAPRRPQGGPPTPKSRQGCRPPSTDRQSPKSQGARHPPGRSNQGCPGYAPR